MQLPLSGQRQSHIRPDRRSNLPMPPVAIRINVLVRIVVRVVVAVEAAAGVRIGGYRINAQVSAARRALAIGAAVFPSPFNDLARFSAERRCVKSEFFLDAILARACVPSYAEPSYALSILRTAYQSAIQEFALDLLDCSPYQIQQLQDGPDSDFDIHQPNHPANPTNIGFLSVVAERRERQRFSQLHLLTTSTHQWIDQSTSCQFPWVNLLTVLVDVGFTETILPVLGLTAVVPLLPMKR